MSRVVDLSARELPVPGSRPMTAAAVGLTGAGLPTMATVCRADRQVRAAHGGDDAGRGVKQTSRSVI